MSGVRAVQVADRRAQMLAAAGRLFEAHGYARTTFEDIATASGFGVSTVYKYFGTKEALVDGLLRPDLDELLARGRAVIADPPPDPADAVIALLSCYRDLGGHNWARREILKLTVFAGIGNEAGLTRFIRDAEAGVQAQIRALLVALRANGRLASRLPVEVATGVIFALLNQHFGEYTANPAVSFARTFRRLIRAVRVVFADWRAPAGQ